MIFSKFTIISKSMFYSWAKKCFFSPQAQVCKSEGVQTFSALNTYGICHSSVLYLFPPPVFLLDWQYAQSPHIVRPSHTHSGPSGLLLYCSTFLFFPPRSTNTYLQLIINQPVFKPVINSLADYCSTSWTPVFTCFSLCTWLSWLSVFWTCCLICFCLPDFWKQDSICSSVCLLILWI